MRFVTGTTMRPRSRRDPRYMLMQPTQLKQPFHRDGWIYEEKIDGWRMVLAFATGMFFLIVP